MEDTIRRIYVDTVLESYRNFFDNDWAASIVSIARDSAQLLQMIYDLTLEWRGAAYNAALPVELLEHVKSFYDGFVRSETPNTDLLQLSEALTARLGREIQEIGFDPVTLRRVQAKIIELGAQIQESVRNAPLTFPLEQAWDQYLNVLSYRITLWGSQRISYLAIYNSYENFLTQCVRIARGEAKYRMSRDFSEHFKNAFGDELLDVCWTNQSINIARLARHALSHAGGRLTSDLSKQNHGFIVESNSIQVAPDKTKGLYDLLKGSVHALSEKAITIERFR